MSEIINPKILKGFRDSLPEDEILKKSIIKKLEFCFESFGFVPIDTPVLEYSEILLGKGGGETEKQIYRFKDNGDRDVSMRFDLTVPFARFISAHINEINLPFKRYHINKVWRGESTQKGRYREFFQCDFDIVGIDSAESDFEILSIMNSAFNTLGIKDVVFHISDRAIFNSFLENEGIREKSETILRTVDKISKIGKDEVSKILEAEIDKSCVKKILEFITPEDSFLKTLEKLKKFSSTDCKAIERLSTIYGYLKVLNIQDKFILNPAITRGLDYYTGIVYETFLKDLPEIGSICSGGRYNDLASLYTKQSISGVGASIGLDRLLTALEELKLIKKRRGVADAIVFNLEKSSIKKYIELADLIRKNGINCELFLEDKKISKQFSYAESQEIDFAFICGETEFSSNFVTLKNLKTRVNYPNIKLEDAIKIIKEYRCD